MLDFSLVYAVSHLCTYKNLLEYFIKNNFSFICTKIELYKQSEQLTMH